MSYCPLRGTRRGRMCDGGRNGPLAGRGGGLAAVALKVAIAVTIATVLQMMVKTKRGTLQQLMMW